MTCYCPTLKLNSTDGSLHEGLLFVLTKIEPDEAMHEYRQVNAEMTCLA
jgi:hypothetical protein